MAKKTKADDGSFDPDAPVATETADTPADAAPVSFVYQPHPNDNDVTSVYGVEFKAYEPVQLDPTNERHAVVMPKLAANPWFAKDGEQDEERHAAWKRVREVKAQADKLKSEHDELVKSHD